MLTMKRKRSATCSALILLLGLSTMIVAGCGSGPSSDEVQKQRQAQQDLLKKVDEAANAQIKKRGSSKNAPPARNIKAGITSPPVQQ
jgi:hypothetical protein